MARERLSIVLVTLYLILLLGQSVTGMLGYNHDQVDHESLQNRQSEFLALAAMVILSIYLRQRGSPASKPVDSPHSETGKG